MLDEESRDGHAAESRLKAMQKDSTGAENLTLPSTTYENRHSAMSQKSDTSGNGEDFFIPMTLDPNLAPGPSPMVNNDHFNSPSAEKENIRPQPPPRSGSRDYFNAKGPSAKSRKYSAQDHPNSSAPPQPDSPKDSGHLSQPSSPHIAYQEIGRELSSDTVENARRKKENGAPSSINAIAHDRPRGESPSNSRSRPPNGESSNGKFLLQEVPKRKKSGGSARNSQSDPSPAADPTTAPTGLISSKSAPPAVHAPVREQQAPLPSTDSPRSLRLEQPALDSPRTAPDSRSVSNENGVIDTSTAHSSPVSTQLQTIPQRGDSLVKSKQPSSRKENMNSGSASKMLASLINTESEAKPLTAPPAIGAQYAHTPSPVNGTRTVSKPLDSPESGYLNDLPQPPVRSRDRLTNASGPSLAPSGIYHKARNESISTLKSESTSTAEPPASPQKLPRYSAGQDLSMDEDMARILGNEDQQNHDSFLRRVSNSVRHARSYSDRGTRLPREPKWSKSSLATSPIFGPDLSSPTSSSPESREEVNFLRNELRRERQKSVEVEQRLLDLEAALEAKSSIKQLNSELREKRSTMVVLDTHKEIVVRELEVLTEHIAEAKKSREPLDLGKMSNTVLREFAESLQKLKESFTPQIEELTQKRNELVEEVSNVTQLKDQSFQDFKQLSLKNAQLMELNNTLVHQIQELYKANASPSLDIVRSPPNGLGIYNHSHKEASIQSFDHREMRPSFTESATSGSTLIHEHDAEPATYVAAPQVVNIRKGQPKKFNWKKGGQNVAKGVTKGLKGAFTSSDGNKPQREGHYTEGIAYGQMAQGQNYPTTDTLRNQHHDPSRQGFAFFSGNQKGKPSQRSTPNGSMPAVNQTGAPLFGSELQHRAEQEGSDVPSIVMKCISEVEVRGECAPSPFEVDFPSLPKNLTNCLPGMELEGIYRKSGGNSQIQQVKEGFERTNDYDISDPDLDINAVTSCLKQYFRKLPTPLITYDVYDKLLDCVPPVPHSDRGGPQVNPNHNLDPEQREQRIQAMRQAIDSLPPSHRTCLEVLIFHLARVVEHEKSNLMTSLNVAVVFAPTVMRPESLAREMSESSAKNQAVQFLIENCHGIFLRDKHEQGGRWE